MHYAGLREEIKKEVYNGKTDQEIADMLNAEVIVVSKEKILITEATLMEKLGPTVAETILQKLEAIGQVDPIVKRASTWFKPSEQGINIASEYTRGMIDQLVALAGITAEEGVLLKSIGETKMSLSQSLGCSSLDETVTTADIVSVR